MISVQLENILKTKFDIDNHKLNMQDSLEQNIVKFTDIIKDNFKGSKMIDESMVHTMKEVWEAISERFKALNLQKHQKTSTKRCTKLDQQQVLIDQSIAQEKWWTTHILWPTTATHTPNSFTYSRSKCRSQWFEQ